MLVLTNRYGNKRRRRPGRRRAATARLTAFAGSTAVLGWLLCSTAVAQKPAASAEWLPLGTLIGLGALALVPFVFMTATSFVKLSIVFSILRNALGTGQVPSGMIITALAAVLTFYVMAPVGAEMASASAAARKGIDPGNPLGGKSGEAVLQSIATGKEPLRLFLKRNAGKKEIDLFVRLSRRSASATASYPATENDLMVALSAFLITELKEAFQIGFLLFLPFLVIDMVVANILLALGMHMMSPSSVSLPFKLLLFVLVDGFYLLTQALLLGYR
jgi:type III secretion protein R